MKHTKTHEDEAVAIYSGPTTTTYLPGDVRDPQRVRVDTSILIVPKDRETDMPSNPSELCKLGTLPDGEPQLVRKDAEGQWRVFHDIDGQPRAANAEGAVVRESDDAADRVRRAYAKIGELKTLVDALLYDECNLARFIARQLIQGRRVLYAAKTRQGAFHVHEQVEALVGEKAKRLNCSWNTALDGVRAQADTLILHTTDENRRERLRTRVSDARPLVVDWCTKSAFPQIRWHVPNRTGAGRDAAASEFSNMASVGVLAGQRTAAAAQASPLARSIMTTITNNVSPHSPVPYPPVGRAESSQLTALLRDANLSLNARTWLPHGDPLDPESWEVFADLRKRK